MPTRAQQQQEPEDPEDEKQIGLWLDQGISTGLSPNTRLDIEFHEQFDEGGSNLYQYFAQGGIAFSLRPWLTLIPMYRYQRYPANPKIAYENRLQLNLTLSTSRGPWKPILRTAWRPVVVLNNEFFLVPGNNPFANRGSSYTQNRFQVGVRLPISAAFSIRPYYMVQSVNLPAGWDTNEIVGISLAVKIQRRTRGAVVP